MKHGYAGRVRSAARNRGFALIAFLMLVVLVSAYVIADQLTRTNSELAKFREDRTMTALRQAKAALIAYAASEEWQLYKTSGTSYFQPGALPCPDKDDDGDANCIGAGITPTSSIIGRLPWKTLGIDDLRDSSGERLWYALSWNFRKLQGGAPPTIINSDTPGQLTVTGSAPATRVVAIVFAPGAPLGLRLPPQCSGPLSGPSQDRVAGHETAANYLENFDLDVGVGVYYTFATSAQSGDCFNDRLIVITQADIMAAVEPVVAARIERDIKPYLDTYVAHWGRYPFPVLFGDPATSDYKGVAGQVSGLMPLTADSTFVTWQNPPVVSDSPSGSITSQDCAASSITLIDCTVAYNGTPTLDFSLAADNAGMAFVRKHVISDLAVTVSGSPLSPAPNLSSVNNLPPPVNIGKGTVLLSLSMPPSAAPVRIQIPPPPLQPPPPIIVPTSWDNTMITLATPSSAAGAGWFIANQWYKQLFYAVAPDLLPGGGGNCIATPPCLTVNNLASPNNKRVILVLAGRELNGLAPRPANLQNYLEGANFTAGTTFVYEHRAGAPTAINDRVVVVAP